jgi:ActR/RegA family two-component response regulator
MNPRTSILFVDDDPSIRQTLPVILTAAGFDVTVSADVPQALSEITQRPFDILLTDLNLGELGDGFMLVSAMRRVQPRAATIIITGYPGFESALKAIQTQVDDYIVKPADPKSLLKKLRSIGEGRPLRQQPPLVRVFDVLRERKDLVLRQWLSDVESDPDVGLIPMSAPDRLAYLPRILDAIIELGDGTRREIRSGDLQWATMHGQKRRDQGYFATLLADEIRVVEKIVLQLVEQELLRIDLSLLFTDLQKINELFRLQQRETIRAFLEEPVEPVALT